MNNTSKKVISLLLCASLITGTIGSGIYYIASAQNESSAFSENVTIKKEKKKKGSENAEKNETVYVLSGADGNVQKIIVSDWLKNTAFAQNITDSSALSDIENVKGDEDYTVDNDSIIWNADGQDIYYRGSSYEELPVGIKISYKLDGEEISPESLAGKSGKVTVRFDYTNYSYEMKKIDGKDEKIFVPFAMLTGMILDNNVFRNVEVVNGKLINDGMRSVVAGVAFPELKNSLGLDKKDIEIPEYIEITADVTDFKMGMTATIATNEIFNEIDMDNLDSESNITDSVSELSDAMKKLEDGSSALYDGLCELLEKSGELVKGIDQLSDGSKKLLDGTKSLSNGASELQTGADQLNDGLQTIVKNNDSLNGGAKQVFDTLLATANSQIDAAGLDIPTLTIDNYGTVLDSTISSLDNTNVYNQALSTVTEAVNAQKNYIWTQVETAVRQQVYAQVKEVVIRQMKSTGITDEMLQSDEIQKQITVLCEKNTNEQMESSEIKSTVNEQVELQIQKVIAENMASDEVQGKLATASEGIQSLISLKSQLDSYNEFYTGLLTYTDGVSQAADGASKLSGGVSSVKSGADQLNKGAGELNSGIKKMQDATPELIDGIKKLRDGSLQLSDGLKEFDEKGISKIINVFDDNFGTLTERMKAIKSVSQNYKAFSGISDDMDGQVKFFFRTDGIE
ncbi:MAG: hypothetical protein K2I00_01385 [Ruminococcus sp.]|nr:hypothetical protein [Ruminococcus sp.]